MSAWRYRASLMVLGDQLRRQGAMATARQTGLPTDTALLEDYPLLDLNAVSAVTVGWAIEWSRTGFPLVRLSELHVAHLMATPAGELPDLAAPWPAFAIEVPEGLLFARDPLGAPTSVTTVHALVSDGEARLFGSSGEGAVWAGPVRRLANLSEPLDDVPGGLPFEDIDERMLALLERLFAGVCVELHAPGHREAIEAGIAERAKANPRRDLQMWLYRAERVVLVDVREAVRRYVLRGGPPPNLRPVVPRGI